MTQPDIVERLRQRIGLFADPVPMWDQAADEIERLNEDRKKYFLENLEMTFEVERLRGSIDQLIKDRDGERNVYNEAIARHLAEVEQLTAVANAARDLIENIRENGMHDNWKATANALAILEPRP